MKNYGFYSTSKGIALRLDTPEIEIMEMLLGDLEDLVRPDDADYADPLAEVVGIDSAVTKPQDDAVARLFPDAYGDDDDAAGEFRRFTERGLRNQRMEQFAVLRDLLGRASSSPVLSSSQTAAALGAINDLRLVLGTRLGIEDDDDNEGDFIGDDEPGAQLFALYQWLTGLQSQLLHVMMDL